MKDGFNKMDYRNIIILANTYIRGYGVTSETGKFAKKLGNKAMVIGGKTALSVSRESISKSLAVAGVDFKECIFTSDVSENTMKCFAREATNSNADLVIGVGGGKAIDCSKWVADYCNLPYISVPTSVATCASVVSLIITYTDEGKPIGGIYSKKSPKFAIVDTKIIAEAPTRLTVAGIGDTLSKWPETNYVANNLKTNIIIEATNILGKLSFDTCLKKGEKAIESAKRKKVSPDLVDVIDNNLLISAMVGNLAGPERRTAVAHSVDYGLVALGIAKKLLHGEKVAYGTLIQMAICEDINSSLLEKVLKFLVSIGLPTDFEDLGIEDNQTNLELIAKASYCVRLRSGPVKTSLWEIKRAMAKVNCISKEFKNERK